MISYAVVIECVEDGGYGAWPVITRQAIRRDSFTSVKELTAAIGAFIDHWNEHPVPFAWSKDADEILGKIERAKTKTIGLTDH